MKELPRKHKLDFVLSALQYHSKSINEIQDDLGLERNATTFQEVRQILGKLIKDEHIEELKVLKPYEGPPEFKPSEPYYYISYKLTYEGNELIKKGGYKKKRIKDFFKNNYILKEAIKILIGVIVGYLISQSGCLSNKPTASKELKERTTKAAVKSQ